LVNREENNQIEVSASELHTHQKIHSLREPAIRAAINTLNLPRGSYGLDAGCGIGLITHMLSEAISPGGYVIGLDLSADFVIYANNQLEKIHSPHGVSFQEGDVNSLPFNDHTFDWVWSADTLWPGPPETGCPSDDPFAMVKELARIVKPGGTLAILFWSSQKLLPGHPLLEARLNMTSQATAPFIQGMNPEQHILRGLSWLRDAGLGEVKAHTFIADVSTPLNDSIQDALLVTFNMFWGNSENEVPQDDWNEFNRICRPESPDFILNNPDYYAFLTYTMFYGKVVF